MKVITDIEKIEEILTRSVDKVYPTKDALKELLTSGKQLKLYVGIDPTADYVHLGHSTNYLLLERFHKLGHKIVVLVGDFTAMIGDPSDKTAARVQLTKEQILNNLETFKLQIGKILDFNNKENPIDFTFNGEWLSALNFEKLIDLASNFTVQQMLERDMFEKRMEENKPLFVHEFFYPLMQGYDSVALDVDLEIGGTDQTFNMLAGRILCRRYLQKEKLVLTTTLLTNPKTGEKLMSKSLGTGVGLNETADNMFGKIMALPDEGVIQTFVDCTRLPMNTIELKKQRLKEGENPKNIKLELAQEIVKMYHGADAAISAIENWENTFSKKENPTNVPQFKPDSYNIISILVDSKLAPSKTEAKRIIEQGGVRVNGNIISDDYFTVEARSILQKGKMHFLQIL